MSYLLSTADIKMTQKSFNFARKFSLPLYFVSAADGTNVVKVMVCGGRHQDSQVGQGKGKPPREGLAARMADRAGPGLG